MMDMGDNGALHGHRSALTLAAATERPCIIMEDDAIPVVGFTELANDWLERFPDQLISFYLGTSRPPQWQARVDAELGSVAATSHIHLPTLIHGVCYAIPPDSVGRVLGRMRGAEADFSVGRGWGRPVLYPVESLVEHRDGTPVERHPDGEPRTERRVARSLAGPLIGDL